MEIDTVSMAQSHAVQDVGPSVLNKSLNQKEEQALGLGNHGREVEPAKSENPSLGQKIDLFT